MTKWLAALLAGVLFATRAFAEEPIAFDWFEYAELVKP